MADKKISQLTGAATPLAGSEVLPIVQGGQTRKVSIADVTAGRAVSTGALSVVGANAVLDNTFSLSGKLVAGTEVGMIRRNSSDEVAIDEDGYGTTIGFNRRFNFSGGGNLTLGIGNFIVGTAGKGIDFSANTHAAGMTSELLNDYEEGTWTPTLATNGFSGGATLSSASGTYTKIGRQVTLQCALVLSGFGYPAALTEIGGIPYTPTSKNAGAYMGAHPTNSMGGACGVADSGAVIYIPPSVGTGTSTVWSVTITYFV